MLELHDRHGSTRHAQSVVIILVTTVSGLFCVFVVSMFCVLRRCRRANNKFPDSQPLKKRVVVMRSNILYANPKDQNSQVREPIAMLSSI